MRACFGCIDALSGKTKENRDERICAGHRGLAVTNDEFRRVLYTAKHCQLVVMALKPGRDRGRSPCARSVLSSGEGSGEAVLDGVRTAIRRVSPSSSRPDESQHHQYRQCSAEALYALCAPIIGRRCPQTRAERRRTTNTSTAKQRNRESLV